METRKEKFITSVFILILVLAGEIKASQKQNVYSGCEGKNQSYLPMLPTPKKFSYQFQKNVVYDCRNSIMSNHTIERSFDSFKILQCNSPHQSLSNVKHALSGSDSYLLSEGIFQTSVTFNSLNQVDLKNSHLSKIFSNKFCENNHITLKSETNSLHSCFYNHKQTNSTANNYLVARKSFKQVNNGSNNKIEVSQSFTDLLMYESPIYKYPSKSGFTSVNALYEIPMNSNSASKNVKPLKPVGNKYNKYLLLRPSLDYYKTRIHSGLSSKYVLPPKTRGVEYQKISLLHTPVGDYHTQINPTSSSNYILPPKPEVVECNMNLHLQPSVNFDDLNLSNSPLTGNITDIPHYTAPLRFTGSLTYSNTPFASISELKSSMSSAASFSDVESTEASTSMSDMQTSHSSGYLYTSADSSNLEDSSGSSLSTSTRACRSSAITSSSEPGYAENRFISSSFFNDSDTSSGYNMTNITDEYL